ncbi:MAG: metallophosphoesterase, partial [Acidimicrobiia bacterium]
MSPAKRRISGALLTLCFVWLTAGAAEAASITRGPYLQMGTPAGVVVRWRTDVATDSRVSYGLAPGSLTSVVEDPALTTEHVVTLSGLSPDTPYYYSVGTTTPPPLAGDDDSHFFLTSPQSGTAKPTRIWVLGDSGTANDNARAVRNAYYTFTGTRHTDLWLMLGDNAYSDGTDSQYQAAVFNMYPEMLRKSVLWPTLGNHDGHMADSATQSGPYYDIFTLPKNGDAGGLASGTEAYYSFDYGNIHFVVLDSFETSRSPGGAMMTWLAQDVISTTQDWIIAYWHHPPHSKGFHDSDTNAIETQMRQYALPILEDHGVDLVLAGHNHSYE